MATDADPRLLKAIRALDAERQQRIRAERQSRALQTQLMLARRRLAAAQRTTDGKPRWSGASDKYSSLTQIHLKQRRPPRQRQWPVAAACR